MVECLYLILGTYCKVLHLEHGKYGFLFEHHFDHIQRCKKKMDHMLTRNSMVDPDIVGCLFLLLHRNCRIVH